MGVLRDVNIIWDELLDAFENTDPDVVYILDRISGEIYLVPSDYDDDRFWQDVATNNEQYLPIPGFDYSQERLLLHEFIQKVENVHLKEMLGRAFAGKIPYGKVEEILSFYPEEMDELESLRDNMLSKRVKQWLEEHDLYSPIDVTMDSYE
ncbi:hypothetical protein OR1_02432 [Geobacter sp. OR-1]|uniref:UPF0158 family protein n=1 Tax=Geobacter sp. OR-1 TaxID=1266765 RepID=UPI000543C8FB|nr:UPF0158 family protein [Geobacter sp. OR-1]GAM10144.1 hypothetical protein OR1_02432 [Geobacter sp. OR-1]